VTTRRPAAGKAGAAARVVPPSRGGRPSKAAAEQLVHRIEDAAAELFFSLGYGATTIEAVAKRARVSKRTFYDRFDDKPALFNAVVHHTIDRMRPPAGVPLVRGANLKTMLRGIAELIMRAALSPQAIALHRLIVAESSRFPDLAAVVNNQGASEEAIRLIAGLLERETPREKLRLGNATFAAQQFLYMLMTVPQRRAMGLGTAMSTKEVEAWVRDTVNLFLNGCRGWDRSNH
jgi:TetR/AcrR family transcriptional repressor of mexJK operon